MKYLLIGKQNKIIQSLAKAIQNTEMTIVSNDQTAMFNIADVIIADSNDITDIANQFPEESFYGVFAKDETISKSEAQKKFEDNIEKIKLQKGSDYPKNITVFQEIDTKDMKAKAEEMANTLTLHKQLHEIVNELKNTSILETKDDKIVVVFINPETLKDEEELQSTDIFTQSLLFDDVGFNMTMKQWFCHKASLAKNKSIAQTKRKAIYETLNDFEMVIYHLYGDDICIHNDTDVFWIEDITDPDNYCDAHLLKDLAAYYGVKRIRKIITDDEYACMLL